MVGVRKPSRRAASCGIAIIVGFLLSLAVTAAANLSLAANPQFSRIAPPGGQRGTELDIQLTGARLADAQEVLFYYPGIQVKSLKAAAANRVDVRLEIAPDCRMGTHAFRIRTATGLSNLRTFSVGSLPQIDEKEPNNDFEQPQKVPLDTAIHGVVQSEDVDCFLVEATKGQRIVAEVEGIRLGDTFFDPHVSILDMERFVLAGTDDTALLRQDPVAAGVAPKDGSYVIQVRESSFGGSGACRYRLHVGSFPRPLAVYPAGGRLGQALEVRYLGDPAGERTEKVTLPTEPPPMFGLFSQDEHGISPSANVFRLSELDNVLETEPNNAPDAATAFGGPAALNGVIGAPGDVDLFKFPAKKGQVYDVRVHARSVRSPLDSVLDIRRASGAGVASNDDSGSPDAYVRLRVPEDDEYVISVRDHLLAGGPTYVYRVEVAPVGPRLTMGLPERASFVDTTVSVPQGNRTAVLVSARREDFGGEMSVEVKDVPAGVTFETVAMTVDRNLVPVLFTAAAAAQPAGSLADVVGTCKVGDRTIEGRLRQRTSLVRGQNNREMWNHYTERMATAVTQAAPYRIEIVQPKVPLVQNGSMGLKVTAKRNEGFAAPIVLKMLYNPPGVASPTSVTMAGEKSEVIIPLTANSGAAVRTWKIAVTGQATVGDGPVLVSTQLADLDVSTPLFTFKFPSVSVEQGQPTELALGIVKGKDFEGAAKVELVGLPNEVTTKPLEFNKDATEIVFPLTTTGKSPPGHHKGLRCRAIVVAQGEPITHMLGSGELRIFKPLPPKPAEAEKPKPKPAAPAPAPDKPPEKRLTRLEQLRLDREQAKQTTGP